MSCPPRAPQEFGTSFDFELHPLFDCQVSKGEAGDLTRTRNKAESRSGPNGLKHQAFASVGS